MNDQEINIAIAEACGWSVYLDNTLGYGIHHGAGHDEEEPIPDYCNDLNAMHEAEKMMIANKSLLHFWKYAASLKRQFPNLGDDGYIHATARQRAEAFLRTIGMWKE